MSTITIGPLRSHSGTRQKWLYEQVYSHINLYIRLLIFVILPSLITTSSTFLINSVPCSVQVICITVNQFDREDGFFAQSITTTLIQQIAALTTNRNHPILATETAAYFIDPNEVGLAPDRVRAFAQKENTHVMLWGGITGQGQQRQLYIQLSPFTNVGDLSKIRPTRVHTFFSEQISATIPCQSCDTFSSAEVVYLQIVSHLVVGWAHYLKDSPEQASQELLTVLACSGEEIDPALLTPIAGNCVKKLKLSNLVPLYYYTGKALALQGDYPRALHFLRKAQKLAPDEPSIPIGIGQVYQSWLTENQPLLLAELDLARRLLEGKMGQAQDEEQVWIEYDLGLVAEMVNDFLAAKTHFQRALALLDNDQQSYEILLGLARSERQLKQPTQAQQLLQQATNIEPNAPWAFLELAQLPNIDVAEKLSIVEEAATVAPNEPMVDVANAELCKSQKDYTCAIQAYERAIEKRPAWGWLHSKVGEFYQPTNEHLPYQSWVMAQLHFKLVADQLRPNDPWAHERLAYVLLKQQAFDHAVEHYQRAIALAHADFIPARLYCGLSLAQEGQDATEDAKQNHKLCNS